MPLLYQTSDSVLGKALLPSRDGGGSRIQSLLDFRIAAAFGKHQNQTRAKNFASRERTGE
jgi:hypothetical protein